MNIYEKSKTEERCTTARKEGLGEVNLRCEGWNIKENWEGADCKVFKSAKRGFLSCSVK